MKLPDYIVRSISIRIVDRCKEKQSMGRLLLNGNCPLCGDTRSRFYVKDYGDDHMAYCHNCGYSKPFQHFLKVYFPLELSSLKELFMDNLKNGEFFKKEKQERIKKLESALNGSTKLSENLWSYCALNGFPIKKTQMGKKEFFRIKCLKYLKKRKIPKNIVKDFWCFTKGPLRGYIGIPFFDRKQKNLIHIQGRMVRKPTKWEEDNKAIKKYLFLKDVREDNPVKIEIESKPIWGIWRINTKERVVICEGTLDACAFKNSIATCGATLSNSFIRELRDQFPNRVWCVDNFWKDEAGRKLTKELLKMGEKCLIIPQHMTSKDPNDLLKELGVRYIPDDFVKENIYDGKVGLTKLTLLKMGMKR